MKEIVTMEREMLNKYQLDALVTMSPENITYITGAYIPTQVTVRSRKVIHIMTRNADPVVIVVNIEEPIMRSQSWMAQESIISYNEFTQNPVLIAIERRERTSTGWRSSPGYWAPPSDLSPFKPTSWCRRW